MKAKWSEARFWLEKAHDLLSTQSLETMETDAKELYIDIMHCLGRALLNLGDDECRATSWNIILKLELECGDRLTVLLLRLDHIASDPASSSQDYFELLLRIARTVQLTDNNVKIILHHVHRLASKESHWAHTVLKVFLTERLLGMDQPKWVEKVLVTMIWNCATIAATQELMCSLEESFDTLTTRSCLALSPSATHAGQILLWKCIESSYNQKHYSAADEWCRLSLHKIFQNSGNTNVAILHRKRILCALGLSDPAKAFATYSQMSSSSKEDIFTQYLMFKVAVRLRDVDLATECLETIHRASDKDATMLYACVLEAQRIGDDAQSIACLKRVLAKYDYNAPREVHLPALLRCTARLLIREIDNPHTQVEDASDEICKLFEGAAMRAEASKRDAADNLFSSSELDWFSRNSYNMALKICTSWSPQQTIRLTRACLRFIALYPDSVDASAAEDLSLRKLFCNFLSVSLLVILARAEDNLENQLQNYLELRKAAQEFRVQVRDQLDSVDSGAREDLQRKYSSLVCFDYEAAARLKHWASLRDIIKAGQRQVFMATR